METGSRFLDLQKLGKVLGLLGSSADGEVTSAARQADRMVRDAGLTWPDVLAAAQPFGQATPLLRHRGVPLVPPYGRTWLDTVHHLLTVHRDRIGPVDRYLIECLAVRLRNPRQGRGFSADDAQRVIRIHASLQPEPETRP